MKHDFEAVLRSLMALDKNGDLVEKVDFIEHFRDEIAHALKIAQKLMEEPSDAMTDGEARDHLLMYSLTRNKPKHVVITDIWKAMVEQMKKELE